MRHFFKFFSPDFLKLFLEKFPGRMIAMYAAGIVIYPVFHCLYLCVRHSVKICPLWYFASYHFISNLICATLPAAIRVAVI